ncbi:MAG: hypothetical protein RL642_1475, partial [Bacteroidota bacterium]
MNKLYSSAFYFIALLLIFSSCRKAEQELTGIVKLPSVRSGNGVMDIDGNKYPTVILSNGQEWMSLNLRVKRFRNGEVIPDIQDGGQWAKLSTGARYSSHPNTPAPINFYYDTLYGQLYNYHAVSSPAGLCPAGWHVPTDSEWKLMEKALGMSATELDKTGWRGDQVANVAGKLMANPDQFDLLPIWFQSGGTNESGFTAVSNGWRSATGRFMSEQEYFQSYWWTVPETGTKNAWARGLDAGEWGVDRNLFDKKTGFSIRCIKGEGAIAPNGITNVKLDEFVEVPNQEKKFSINITGNIGNDGGNPILKSGVCWSTSPNPTLDDSLVLSTDKQNISVTVTVGGEDRKIYFRVFALNEYGIGYSEDLTSKTPLKTVKDIEGNEYKTFQLPSGTRWMAENLRTSKFANGQPIPNITDDNAWGNLTTAAWCYYNNNSNFNIEHGKLYNFFTVLDYRNVCPSGWHVSTDEDWRELEVFLGMSIEESLYDSFDKGFRGTASNVGGKLKSSTGWNQNGTDAVGFNAKPSGLRSVHPGLLSGYNVSFDVLNQNAYFWTSSFDNNGKAWERILMISNNGVTRNAGVTDPSLGFNFNHSKNGYSI